MNKEEFIGRYGEAAYARRLKQQLQSKSRHPEKVKARDYPRCRKGGKHYEKRLKYEHSKLRGRRNKIRANHSHKWRQYKKIIAPESQLHHEWIPGTAEYRGIALVERKAHQQGIIDVIKILGGTITLFVEKKKVDDAVKRMT